MAALLPALLCLLPEPEPEPEAGAGAGARSVSRVARVTVDVRVSRDATVRPPQPQPLSNTPATPAHTRLQP